MPGTLIKNRSSPLRRTLAGAALVAAGALGLAALIYISNSRAPAAEHALFSLGLAGSALLSASFQGLVFLGAWMLWRGLRGGRRLQDRDRR